MPLTPLQQITYGLYVVGCYSDGLPAGCVINTCFQVTSQNPALAICLNKGNFTLDAIRRNPRFSLSIVAEDTDPDVIARFGFHSSRDTDKYAPFGYDDLDGSPAVRGNFCGRLVLDAFDFVDCDTHFIVLARLVAQHEGAGTPMTYAYYHRVIKGSAPKAAPTYVAPEAPAPSEVPAETTRRYRCDVCGYIAETAGDLPADYRCPVCGVDRTHFHLID